MNNVEVNDQAVSESILYSIAKKVGIEPCDIDSYKTDLLIDINSVFVYLNDIGVGPEEVFHIEDETATWSDFEVAGDIWMVMQYIFIKVKLMFDPPANSFLVSSLEDSARRIEWTLRERVEVVYADQ
jgi:hypothetical protein